MDSEAIKKQAEAEFEVEKFQAAVTKEKEKLRIKDKYSNLRRKLFPWFICHLDDKVDEVYMINRIRQLDNEIWGLTMTNSSLKHEIAMLKISARNYI